MLSVVLIPVLSDFELVLMLTRNLFNLCQRYFVKMTIGSFLFLQQVLQLYNAEPRQIIPIHRL